MLLTQNNHLYQPPSILTCAHSLVPIEVMTLDFAIRAFQASQQASRIASYVCQTQLLRALPRRYSQMFSAGFSSGAECGSGRSTMFSGTTTCGELCQPAASRISRAMAPGLTHLLISARCLFMASMLTVGMTNAAPVPRAGQMAPKR